LLSAPDPYDLGTPRNDRYRLGNDRPTPIASRSNRSADRSFVPSRAV